MNIVEGADAELQGLQFQINGPWGYDGTNFNVGEYAYIGALISNPTTSRFRDVTLQLVPGYNLSIVPESSWYPDATDGRAYKKVLEPGGTLYALARVKAISSGDVLISARVTGEIVPYRSRTGGWKRVWTLGD